MTTVAVPRYDEKNLREEPRGWKAAVLSQPVAAAIVSGTLAVLVAVGGPMVARSWQVHEKRLEVRTVLANDMSRSFTMAIGAGQRVASGLVYGPTGDRRANQALVQGAYNRGFGQWQVDGGRIRALLKARFGSDDIVREWGLYRQALERFYRLSSVLPPGDRPHYVSAVRFYLAQARPGALSETQWSVLGKRNARFSRSPAYRRAYDQLGVAFLSIGDAFVEKMLRLRPEV